MAQPRKKPLSTNPGTTRAREHQARHRAIRDELGGPLCTGRRVVDESDASDASDESRNGLVVGVGDAAPTELGAFVARRVRRDALDYMRAVFTDEVAPQLVPLTKKAIEFAKEGDFVPFLGLSKYFLPIPKPTGQKINIGIGKIETTADVEAAEVKVATAVLAGDITVEDGELLVRMLTTISDDIARREDQETSRKLQEMLLNTQAGGAMSRVRGALTIKAQQVLTLIDSGQLYEPADSIVDAEIVDAETVDDDWREFA